MATFLSRRHDGIYLIRYQGTDGKEHSRSTGCRKKNDAQLVLRSFRIPGQLEGATLREFIVAYLTFSRSEHKSTTHRLIRDVLKPFLAWAGERLLSEITSAQMDEYRHSLEKDKRPATVLLHLRQLKAMFTYATQREYIPANPMRYQKNLYVKTVSRATVSLEDFGKLLEGLKTKWHRDIVTLAILTGLRRQELLGLLWTDVDLSERLLHVRHGKGDKERWVPLNEQALSVLTGMDQTTERVFVTRTGHSPSLHGVSRLFARARERAKITTGIHFHSLRHAFATLALAGGAQVQDVQKIMGHSSITTTMGYTHLVSRDMHDAVAKLPNLKPDAGDP